MLLNITTHRIESLISTPNGSTIMSANVMEENSKHFLEEYMDINSLCGIYYREVMITHTVFINVLGNALRNESICLVTQLTFQRIDRLQMLALHWKGKTQFYITKR